MAIIASSFLILLVMIYNRYYPVSGIAGVPCTVIKDGKIENNILDVRDYNISSKTPVKGAIMIPTAYLNRYMKEIPDKEVHLVASSEMEKNVGARMLHKKGIKVTGYTVINFSQEC